MLFLDESVASQILCSNEYAPLWNIIGIIINVVKIGIPIILITLGMIDLAKAVIAGKEDEQKKATKVFGKRFLYAIGVFASVWIVTLVLDMASGAFEGQEDYKYDEAAWKKCWRLINGEKTDSTKTTIASETNTKKEEKKCYSCKVESVDGQVPDLYVWSALKPNSRCTVKKSFKTSDACLKNNK